jgi:hypothetical protein
MKIIELSWEIGSKPGIKGWNKEPDKYCNITIIQLFSFELLLIFSLYVTKMI